MTRSGFRSMQFDRLVAEETYGPLEAYGMPAMGPLPREAYEKVGRAILTIAAGDGKITPTELRYLSGLAKALGAPNDVVEGYKSFDPRKVKFEALFDASTKPWARVILYDSIRVARSDGFAEEERETAVKGAKKLGLEPTIVPRIEALLACEDGVRDARLSIIAPPEVWNAPGRTSAGLETENDWWRYEQFGFAGPVPIEAATKVGKAILIIAGADNDLTETELGWYFGMAKALGGPPEVLEELMKFDYRGTPLEEVLTPDVRPMSGVILFDAVRCAASDGFAERERLLAQRATKLLGLDRNLVPWIEGVIQMETATRAARIKLLSPA